MEELVVIECETTNICNATCLFCPHHKFKKFGTMTDELYEKIVYQASKLPNLQTFIPMLIGEPLCDKKFIERLKFARERLPGVTLEFYTNGSLLTRKICNELGTITNLRISLSLNAMTPETRKRMMGLDDFGDVMKSLQYMEEAGLLFRPTMVNHPAISPEEIKAFAEKGGMVIQYQSWCGEQYPYKRLGRTSCGRAMRYMTIFYTGEVSLCCFSSLGTVRFGNLNNQTIEEVWKGDKKREYINLHKQGRGAELPLCCNCTEG